MDKPTIGRVVHLKTKGGSCRAAIVAGPNDDGTVDLRVFWRAGEMPSNTSGPPHICGDHAEHVAEGTDPLTWHWPERT